MKRAGGDEEDVIRLHHAVLRVDRRPFDDRQQIALHAFARNVGAVRCLLAPRDLVDLIEEDDAALFDALDCFARHILLIDELLRLLVDDEVARVADANLLALRLAAEEAGQHVLHVDAHLFDALSREDLQRREPLLFHVELDLALVQLSFIEPAAKLFARLGRRLFLRRAGDERRAGSGAAGIGQQDVEDALSRVALRGFAHVALLFFFHELHAELRQVAHDRFDVPSDVAHFGELRRFDFEERRLRQAGQAARDFGLSDASRADHDDVLWRDLVAHVRRDLLPPPSIAQRDRDRALRRALADDVLVELAHDLFRREPFARQLFDFSREMNDHVQRLSTVMLSFV